MGYAGAWKGVDLSATKVLPLNGPQVSEGCPLCAIEKPGSIHNLVADPFYRRSHVQGPEEPQPPAATLAEMDKDNTGKDSKGKGKGQGQQIPSNNSSTSTMSNETFLDSRRCRL